MLRRRELLSAAVWFAAGFACCYMFAVGPSDVVPSISATAQPVAPRPAAVVRPAADYAVAAVASKGAGHDKTKCREQGERDRDCCGFEKDIACADDYVLVLAGTSCWGRNRDYRCMAPAAGGSLTHSPGEAEALLIGRHSALHTEVKALEDDVRRRERARAAREPAVVVAKREVGPAIIRNPAAGRWPAAKRLCRGCDNQEYIDGNPLWARPATSRSQFCALIPATSKPAYKKYLEIMAETIGRNADVNSWLLFNSHDIDDPSDDETYKLCDELVASGPRMRCLIVNVSTSGRSCPRGRKCAAITIFEASKVLGQDLLASCDWVIKLDPDCVFVPNAAKEFVRKISPQRKVFYGTFSGKLVYSGSPNLWMRTQMPKGNWMVSISTWERMQETAQTSMCTPNGEYPGTDEAAALLCSWYSWGADCVTNWRNFVRIGPAAETPQNLKEHVDRVKIGGQYGHHECVMLVHKYILDEMVTLYHELQALPHRGRKGCGPEGIDLQNSLDYDYNRPAVGGFKFPNKTAIDSTYDCADPSKLQDSGIREPPQHIKEAGRNYNGLTGAEAKEKFKDLPEMARNARNINH